MPLSPFPPPQPVLWVALLSLLPSGSHTNATFLLWGRRLWRRASSLCDQGTHGAFNCAELKCPRTESGGGGSLLRGPRDCRQQPSCRILLTCCHPSRTPRAVDSPAVCTNLHLVASREAISPCLQWRTPRLRRDLLFPPLRMAPRTCPTLLSSADIPWLFIEPEFAARDQSCPHAGAQCHLWDPGLAFQLHLALEGNSEAVLRGLHHYVRSPFIYSNS